MGALYGIYAGHGGFSVYYDAQALRDRLKRCYNFIHLDREGHIMMSQYLILANHSLMQAKYS